MYQNLFDANDKRYFIYNILHRIKVDVNETWDSKNNPEWELSFGIIGEG